MFVTDIYPFSEKIMRVVEIKPVMPCTSKVALYPRVFLDIFTVSHNYLSVKPRLYLAIFYTYVTLYLFSFWQTCCNLVTSWTYNNSRVWFFLSHHLLLNNHATI